MTMTAALLFDDCRWSHKPPYKERQETPLGVQGCSAKVQCRSNMLPDPPAWQRGCWEGSFIHTNHTPRTRTHKTTYYPYACALDLKTKTKTRIHLRKTHVSATQVSPNVAQMTPSGIQKAPIKQNTFFQKTCLVQGGP